MNNSNNISGGENNFEQDFKELNSYLNVLCLNGHDVKDGGHMWIAFTDKFSAFKRRVLAATLPAPIQEYKEEDIEKMAEEYANKKWIEGFFMTKQEIVIDFLAGFKAAIKQ